MKMQIWYRLTAWYWRMTQKMFLFIAVLMTIAEAVTVCVVAGNQITAGSPYDDIFLTSYAWLFFTIAFLAVLGISLRPTLVAQGRTKAGYTLATLPGGSTCALFAQMANTALSILLLTAWQIVTTIALGLVATPINRAATLKHLPQFQMPAWDFTLSVVRNFMIRMLVPTSFITFFGLIFLVLAPSVLLAGALFQRGIKRLGAVVLGVIGAFSCSFIVLMQAEGSFVFRGMSWNIYWPFAVLLIVIAISLVWSLWSARRENWL